MPLLLRTAIQQSQLKRKQTLRPNSDHTRLSTAQRRRPAKVLTSNTKAFREISHNASVRAVSNGVSIYPSACSSAGLSVCLLVCLSVCVCLCLFVCLPICMSVCVHMYLPIFLSTCLPVCLPVCPSALSVCLSVHLSVCRTQRKPDREQAASTH